MWQALNKIHIPHFLYYTVRNNSNGEYHKSMERKVSFNIKERIGEKLILIFIACNLSKNKIFGLVWSICCVPSKRERNPFYQNDRIHFSFQHVGGIVVAISIPLFCYFRPIHILEY